MFAVKYIYIMFEEFFISCESIHESIKSVFDRFLCSDREEMTSHTIIFYFIRYKLIVFRIYTHPGNVHCAHIVVFCHCDHTLNIHRAFYNKGI